MQIIKNRLRLIRKCYFNYNRRRIISRLCFSISNAILIDFLFCKTKEQTTIVKLEKYKTIYY